MAGKGSLTFKPIKGLSISGIVSPFINYQKKKAFKNSCGYTLPDDPETFGGYFDSGSTWTTNSLTETRNDDYNVTSQAIANYGRFCPRRRPDLRTENVPAMAVRYPQDAVWKVAPELEC